MVSSGWIIGLHIQRDGLRAVALAHRRDGWHLKKWWYYPLAQAPGNQGLAAASKALLTLLITLHSELPARHHLRVAFPANRTLQRTMPLPARLCESECNTYVHAVTAKALQMAPGSLFSDYHPDPAQNNLYVTAAHRQEVDDITALIERAGFTRYALTPDACALTSFFPFVAADVQGIAMQDEEQWLWATRERWGCQAQGDLDSVSRTLSIPQSRWICSSGMPLPGYSTCDPWRWLSRAHPPLAPDPWRFTVALGLAMGSYLS